MLAGINVVNAKHQEAILRLWEAAREAGGRNRSAAEAGSPKLVSSLAAPLRANAWKIIAKRANEC